MHNRAKAASKRHQSGIKAERRERVGRARTHINVKFGDIEGKDFFKSPMMRNNVLVNFATKCDQKRQTQAQQASTGSILPRNETR